MGAFSLLIPMLVVAASADIKIGDNTSCVDEAALREEIGPLPTDTVVVVAIKASDGQPQQAMVAVFRHQAKDPTLLRTVVLVREDCPAAPAYLARIVARHFAALPRSEWAPLAPPPDETPPPPAPEQIPPTPMAPPPPPAVPAPWWKLSLGVATETTLGVPRPVGFRASAVVGAQLLFRVSDMWLGPFAQVSIAGAGFAGPPPGAVLQGGSVARAGLTVQVDAVRMRVGLAVGGGLARGLGYPIDRWSAFPLVGGVASLSRRLGPFELGGVTKVWAVRPRWVLRGRPAEDTPWLELGLTLGWTWP